MISDKMTESLNRQINREIYSAYLYLGMNAYAVSIGVKGIANWFTVQSREELAHSQIMYNYVNQQGGRVVLEDIEAPEQDFSSVTELFEKTLGHEKQVTAMISNLVTLAKEEKDYATESFLQWFVTEQVEEEANPTDILQKLNLFGETGEALYRLDTELGQRVFTPPQILVQA